MEPRKLVEISAAAVLSLTCCSENILSWEEREICAHALEIVRRAKERINDSNLEPSEDWETEERPPRIYRFYGHMYYGSEEENYKVKELRVIL